MFTPSLLLGLLLTVALAPSLASPNAAFGSTTSSDSGAAEDFGGTTGSDSGATEDFGGTTSSDPGAAEGYFPDQPHDTWDIATVEEILTPEVRDRILQAVAQDLNRPAPSLAIAAAETAIWDGCMGVATPEQMCSMIAIAGLRLEITDGRQTWVYHARQDGGQVVRNPAAR